MDFQESGYNYKFYKKHRYAPDGIELEPKVLCLFERQDNLELKDIIRYIAVVSKISNSLLSLSNFGTYFPIKSSPIYRLKLLFHYQFSHLLLIRKKNY